MSRHLLLPGLERGALRTPGAGHADVLDAWLGSGSRRYETHEPAGTGSIADWDAPRHPVELAYDTADQGLPKGVRAVVREGSRRLMFEADPYEIVVRVAADRMTEQYELAGQVLFEGLPLPGATVRLERDGPGTTISTDGAGGFRLPPLVHGAYGLSIAVNGAVLTVPPIALR
jgi:hypothetical protein